MLKVDHGLLVTAMSSSSDGPGGTGYLHRRSGQIVFVFEDEERADGWVGNEAMVDAGFTAAIIAEAPDDWVKIPTYDRPPGVRHEEIDLDPFIAEFFKDNGIEAQLL